MRATVAFSTHLVYNSNGVAERKKTPLKMWREKRNVRKMLLGPGECGRASKQKTDDSVRRVDDEFSGRRAHKHAQQQKKKNGEPNHKRIPAHNGNEYYNLNGLIHFISVPAVKESKMSSDRIASPHPRTQTKASFQLNCRHYLR